MTQPVESRLHVNDIDLTVFEWRGEGRPILFAHATGFHARCWDEVIRHLPGRRCIALDMRGHGRSQKLPIEEYGWRQFGEDVAALVQSLELQDVIAVGHSMGGHSVTLAAALSPDAFAGLILLDPVIMPPAAYANPRSGEEHFAARRRNNWASADEMFERFRSRPPYASWQEQVLRDYCNYGLLPNPEGDGYILACPPEVEATIYTMGSGGDIYGELESIEIPVRLLRARSRSESDQWDMAGSPTNPQLVEHFKNAIDLPHPELSHFMPMEAPELVAREVRQLEGSLEG